MGEASRRKKEGREVKDPLRWLRADVAAKEQRMKMLQGAYHSIRAAYEESLEKLEKSIASLKSNGHPLYQDAPETAPAATDNGGEVAESNGQP